MLEFLPTRPFILFFLPPFTYPLAFYKIIYPKQWVRCCFHPPPASFLRKCPHWTSDYVEHLYPHCPTGTRVSTVSIYLHSLQAKNFNPFLSLTLFILVLRLAMLFEFSFLLFNFTYHCYKFETVQSCSGVNSLDKIT